MVKTIIETARGVRSGDLPALQAVEDALAVIAAKNPPLNAFVMLDPDGAREAAREIDAKVARGEDPGPLAGVPFGVKDLEDCAGFRTTQGSVFLLDTAPKTADSVHVARLRAAGAIPIGKTNVPEFGLDGKTAPRAWGVTRNPWNTDLTPGGSSGGSSAAVAAGMTPFATATDGGGSIREPGAFTGLLGLKPSHGRIAKESGFSNWSVRGAMTLTAADTARYLDVAAGPNNRDRQSLPPPTVPYETAIETLEVQGLRAVWTPDYGYAAVDPEVVAIAEAAARRLIQAARLALLDMKIRMTPVIRQWGVLNFSVLEKDFTAKGYLPDGWDKLAESTQLYLSMMRKRRDGPSVEESWQGLYACEQEFAAIFADVDLIFSPATACPAYGAEAPTPTEIGGRDATIGGAQPFGMFANICWNPSISIPAGVTAAGLPVGLQVTGPRHRDDILLRLARIMEDVQPWEHPFA